MSFNPPPPHNPFGPPPSPWDKPPEPHKPWEPAPSPWSKPPEPSRPARQMPAPPLFQPPKHQPLFSPPSEAERRHHEQELRDEEDAIAYYYWQKTRRDNGEEIEDDDTVDMLFGESERPRPSTTPDWSASVRSTGLADDDEPEEQPATGWSGLSVLLVLAALAVALFICWAALMVR